MNNNQILSDEDLKKVSGGDRVVIIGCPPLPPPGPIVVITTPWHINR